MLSLSPEDFFPLPPAASQELARQIEEISPSAVALELKGFAFQLAHCLAGSIESGKPDMVPLRDHGLGPKAAIAVCIAIAARHARRAAALAALKPQPKPAPLPPLPYCEPLPAKPDAMDGMSALSMLHTLTQEYERGRPACLTTLMNAGWTEPTARELVKVVNASLAKQRNVK